MSKAVSICGSQGGKHETRMGRYLSGMTDGAIARMERLDKSAIRDWRKRRGLSPNVQGHQPPSELQVERCRSAYADELDDGQISVIAGISRGRVRNWRNKNNLPAHRKSGSSLTKGELAARMLLYTLGYPDTRIAREQRMSPHGIQVWRKRYGLPANSPSVPKRGDRMAILLRRIKAALPRYLSPADRDDTASDLFVAVMSGGIPIEEIEKRAKTFGNRVIESYASKWGARSLDEEIGDDGDGFTMMDMLADERSSSWLEEMGATVW